MPLRTRLLEGPALLAPEAHPVPAERGRLSSWVRGRLEDSGLALARLDRPLDEAGLLALGADLGRVSEETDPAVLPYVEQGRILNLISGRAATEDVALQPFSAGTLTLHSEGSGRPVATQPRYIVLMCQDPGDEAAAQTVLVPMRAVAERLQPRTLHTLGGLFYQDAPGVPPMARTVGDRTVFSFRDFGDRPLRWLAGKDTGPCADAAAEADDAIAALLAAMYRPETALGIRWQRGTLAVIDNTWFFHGRTAGRFSAGARRHLQRIRVTAR
ncbi:TauD/TfdA family dioxygenase [Streptomyces sp. NPDC006290]|uniref:TauD/TfdA family dioxygenase n=1 Tax=Streptomyces sp. NPDC006290 TaxID=3156745 RepID=UPI0033B9FE6C